MAAIPRHRGHPHGASGDIERAERELREAGISKMRSNGHIAPDAVNAALFEAANGVDDHGLRLLSGRANRLQPHTESVESHDAPAVEAKQPATGRAIFPPVVKRLSDVVAEQVEWLWPERIATGKLTLLAGNPGLGKSFVSLDMSARVSLGAPWPDNREHSAAPLGSVVLLTAEDGLGDTVRPRLDAIGADVTKIVALSAVLDLNGSEVMPNLQRDLHAIDDVIESLGDCKLVVIDPLTAYLGKVDSHVNSDVRSVLAPLSEMSSGQQSFDSRSNAPEQIVHDGSRLSHEIGELGVRRSSPPGVGSC